MARTHKGPKGHKGRPYMKCMSGTEMREFIRLRNRIHKIKDESSPTYRKIRRRLRFLKSHRLCF